MRGLVYLSKHEIAHRDIKPANILVYKNNNNRNTYRLTDFGVAKQ